MFNPLKKLLGDSGSQESQNRDALLSRWKTVECDGHVCDIFEPDSTTSPSNAILFLHAHAGIGLTDNSVFTALFQENNLLCVCPHGGRSWWLDRVCSEFSETTAPQDWLVDSLVPYIGTEHKIEPPHIGLLGVSMGGQGVMQLSFRDAASFPVVAAISPAIDFHQLYGHGLPLDSMFEDIEDARQHTVVLNLHPLAWPRHQWFCCDPDDVDWFDGAAKLGMKLSSSGILHERDFDTQAGGHSWDYFNHMAPKAIEHIVAGLASYS